MDGEEMKHGLCDAPCPHGHTCGLETHVGGNHFCYQCNCVYGGDPLTLHMHDGRDVLNTPPPVDVLAPLREYFAKEQK